jgi:hypothetical protein
VNFIRCPKERSQKSKCIGALSLHPLSYAFKMKATLGIVVVQDVASEA